MKKLLFLSFFAAVMASAVAAQQPGPTPPVIEDDGVVKISTNLIQIDVTVLDKNGKVVTDLKPEDFELYENGEKQQISNFSLITRTAGGATIDSPNTGTGAQAGNVPGPITQLKRGDVRRTIAIVVDDLNLSFGSVYYTREALKKFVDQQMQPDDLVAILRTGGSVGALQQFTSDKRVLYAAIEKIRWNPFFGGNFDSLASTSQNDAEITDRFTNESDLVASGNSKQITLVHPHANADEVQASASKAAKNASSSEEAIYAQASLGAIKYIVSGMAKLPGRKALMLFSDGIAIGADADKSRTSAVFSYLQSLSDAANRSSVVVYTFDTKGLRSMSIAASDNTYEIIDGHRQQKEQWRTQEFKSSQDGLVYFAAQTGGKSLLNSDNFNAGIQRALDEQAGYYLLGYVPDGDTFDPNKRKFNKFEVKVLRPGLKVSYRSGFFSNSAGDGPKPQFTVQRQMAEVLMSPFSHSDIALTINALYADDPVSGPFIRSFLHIDAQGLTFTDTADGWKTSTFDVVAVMTGDNGALVKDIESKYTIKTRGPAYESTLKNGFVYVLVMPVKDAGLYQYRVALRDTASGKIGSGSQIVEIPNLAKQRLTVSSLAVESVTLGVWQNISQGKVGNKPGQIQVPSSLFYDTAIKEFRPGSVLRYGFEVYNAKTAGASLPQLVIQAKILQNDRVITQGNLNKFDASGQSDRKHLKVSGAIMLKDDLAAGDYVLQVSVTDTISKQVSAQLFPFQIVR
ncbi:MAG TPA: VWA domain-containing protein [Pyrinomonadaceae bacterium]|jgi:VWFA-related protein|nr:VWA domain-containing protein [Pyrinomonadaceae bacterium]